MALEVLAAVDLIASSGDGCISGPPRLVDSNDSLLGYNS